MHGIIYLVGLIVVILGNSVLLRLALRGCHMTDMMERTTLPSLQVPYVQWDQFRNLKCACPLRLRG